LSVGIVSFRRGRVEMHELLDRYCKRIDLEPTEGEDRHGFVIPLRPRKDGFVKGRVLLAGDAAGLADPITAEGISFAVGSGRLAARVLWETDFDPRNAKSLYQAELQQSMLEEIRLGRHLARLLFLPRKIRPITMRLMGQGVAEQLADVFCGKTSYRDLLGAL
jgi:flavin-dependent dehydrogenase